MPLSKSFNQTTKPLIRENPAFRRELLVNAANALLAGDLDTAKAILRMYVNGAVGFIPLAAASATPPRPSCASSAPAATPRPAPSSTSSPTSSAPKASPSSPPKPHPRNASQLNSHNSPSISHFPRTPQPTRPL